MSTPPPAPLSAIPSSVKPRRLAWAYLELTKARLVGLVALSSGVGFVLSTRGAVDWTALLWTMLGTALAAGGANALNQALERGRDALMSRTCERPLPAGQISLRDAVLAGLALSVVGPAMLYLTTHWLAAGLAFLNVLLYVLLYTPLKTRSSLSTLIGGVCGGVPVLIGWAAATGELAWGAWVLGLLLYLWQIPHFLALAWLCREDYACAGYRMLPQADQTGELTGRVMLLSSLTLVPVGLMAALAGLGGFLLVGGSIVLGLFFSLVVVRFLLDRSDASARRVFFASLIYLPAFFALLLTGRFMLSLN